jgi:hypothetical protein
VIFLSPPLVVVNGEDPIFYVVLWAVFYCDFEYTALDIAKYADSIVPVND